jgi:hypothetical protein
MRGLRSTLALLVVLVGLGAYIYFYLWQQPEESTTARDKVFGVESSAIQEMTLKSEGGDVTAVKKEGDAWQIVSPIAAPAAESEIAALTSAISSLEIVRVVDEKPAALDVYGLGTPRIEVSYKAGDQSGRLIVGSKTPTGDNLYARKNDEARVVLIPSYQESALNKSTFDLRDKTVIKVEREKIDGVELTRAANQTIQLRKGGPDWRLASPISAQADSGTVDSLISRVETAQMKSVVTSDPTAADLRKFGLERPRVSVVLNLGSARAQLLIGGNADDTSVYAKDAAKPLVVTLDSSLVEDLNKAVDDYRRRDLFGFRAFNATRAELVRGGQTFVFERVRGEGEGAQDTWRRVSPNPGDVDRGKMDALLAGLADIRATSFAQTTAGTGLESPALTVAVKYDEGKSEDRASLGLVGEKAFASLPAGEPGAAQIETQKLNDAIKALEELSK